MNTNEYPTIKNIEDVPFTKTLRAKLAHAIKCNKADIEVHKKNLENWLKLPLIKL